MKGDIFGIGFKNKWFNTEISKNKECWGAGEDIQLSLSNNAKSYNYIQLSSDYGRIRVKYLHGFLESKQANYNRYLTARGIEWTNNETFIIGLSETVIYSGEKRSLDIAYLNPISSHIEIELNNRLNNIGNANSNAVWQIHLDLLYKKKFRFSFNYLYDEFVIDKNIQKNKQDGSAYSGKIAFRILENEKLVFYVQKISVGTPTFRHVNGMNNFINNSDPLGWAGGSDSKENLLGFDYTFSNKLSLMINHGIHSFGAENILNRPYDSYKNYNKGPFPSGAIRKNKYFLINFNYLLSNNIILSTSNFLLNNQYCKFNIELKYIF